MPRLSRTFIKTGMIFFGAALLVLLWRAAANLFPAVEQSGYWMPVFWHLLMVGWITQIIMGVSYWMFPKISRENPYGPVWMGWTCYGLLNGGLLLRIASEPWIAETGVLREAGLAFSALLQWMGGILYVLLVWKRVRGRRRRKSRNKSS